MAYDASSIRILSDQDVAERFEWAKVGSLAAQYKRDPIWIRRGLAACEQVGANPEYFIKRYLEADRSVPFKPEVDEAFRQLLKDS